MNSIYKVRGINSLSLNKWVGVALTVGKASIIVYRKLRGALRAGGLIHSLKARKSTLTRLRTQYVQKRASLELELPLVTINKPSTYRGLMLLTFLSVG